MRGGQSGFTVIELMTVVVIVGILAFLAIPAFGEQLARRRLEGAATDLLTDLQFARSQAVSSGGDVRLRTTSTTTYVIDNVGGTVTYKTVTLPAAITATNGITVTYDALRGAAAAAQVFALAERADLGNPTGGREHDGAGDHLLAVEFSRRVRHMLTRLKGASPLMRRQRGLSIVELLIASALRLFLVGGAITLFIGNLTNSRQMLLDARINQDLRAAADLIARDLRRAGYWRLPSTSRRPTTTALSVSPDRRLSIGSRATRTTRRTTTSSLDFA